MDKQLDWVRRAQQGDRKAFQMLVKDAMPRLFRVVYPICPNRDEVHDILQDAFIKAYRALPGLKQPEAFSGWLLRIAVNTAKNRVTRRKEFATDPTDYTFTQLEAVHETGAGLLQEDNQRLVSEALTQLSPEHREVVALVELQELNCAEAARVLDCPPGTVRSRLFYARKKLKQLLAPYRKHWVTGELS